uniref:DUF1758 domain-containing protein n=1 Tax=Globodera pallida TaxID=36090 RepID=A0A183BU69_GLOPA
MSGAIRSQIGPAKATLIKCLNEAREHLDARPEQTAQGDDWAQWVQHLKNDRLRVEGAINRIDTQIQRWTELMLKLDEPGEREAENAIYEGTATGENGFLAYMEDGHETIAMLTTSIEISGNAVTQNASPAPREQRANGNAPRNRNTIQIRLPTNNLPEFDGNAVLWPTFWDSFSSSIHKNDDISDIDRFNYLHGCLKGEAKRLIQGYFITSANYPLAINKLRDRYGDEKLIKSELRKELQKLPPARKFTNSVRETLDNLERILLQLDQLGEDINQTFILSTIEDKMPKWVLVEMEKAKLEMEEESDADDDEPFEWNSTLAIKCLTKIVRIHESANKAHCQLDAGPKPFFTKSAPRRLAEEESRVFVSHETKRALPTGSGRKAQKWTDRPPPAPNTKPFRRQRRPCIFCKSVEHSTFVCQKYPTGESRQKRLALLKLCPNCFRDNTHEKCLDLRKCDSCDGNHKSIVCQKFDPKAYKSKPFRPTGKEVLHNNTFSIPAETEQAMACTPAQKASPILLMTQKITVTNQSQEISVDGAKVFLDLGATRSFVTNKLAEKLGIETHGKIRPVAIKAHGMFGHQTSFQSFPVKIKLGLRSPSDIYSSKIATFREFSFRTTDKITSKIAMPAISDEKLELLSREKIAQKIDPKIQLQDTDILIGMDYFWSLVTNKKPLKNGYHLIETLLGPVICGGMETEQNSPETNFSLILQRDEGKGEITFENVASYGIMEESDNPWDAEKGYNDLEKCYSLEGLGINDQPEENEDESAQILFDKTIAKCGERYQVRWPFRPNKPALPTNKNLCIKRLYSTIKRLTSITDPNNLIERYDQILQTQLSDGITEEVKTDEGEGLIHYLPHQAVYRPDKKKLRVVMDASAHLHGKPSLNDTMFRGPVLLPKVAGVLLRWREGKIVIACDIASAFLMLELHPSDRNVTRFFWLKDLAKPPTPENIRTFRFCRVLFGAVASPFLLCGTIVHHLTHSTVAKKYPQISKEVEKSVYMDNILILAVCETEATEKIRIVREIFADAGMKLREFLSNDEKTLGEIEAEDKIVPREKFLGIDWEVKRDDMKFKLPFSQEKEWTMRKILRTIHSNFDPLGLISPATLQARLFFQSLWAKKLKWDTPLAEQETKTWNRLLLDWKDTTVIIPRHTKLGLLDTNQHKNCQIHVFTDASESCYATAVYARRKSPNSITIQLLFAKSRLAPKNLKEKGRLTIPKMELLGILIGTRAGNYVKRELNAEHVQTFLWSDSQIALCWIDSNKTLPIFVENRCQEIRKSGFQFRHVNGADNPADYATRGIPAGKLQNKEKWWKGPVWLKDTEENWPNRIFSGKPDIEALMPVKEQINIAGITEKGFEEKFEIVDPNRFGSWNKMIITLLFVIRPQRPLEV